jgi:hypothetical protein
LARVVGEGTRSEKKEARVRMEKRQLAMAMLFGHTCL